MNCLLCDSTDSLERYNEVRTGTMMMQYLVHCKVCGGQYDAFDINDRIYEWSQLPQQRKFTELRDYRDDGHGIVEVTFDLDEQDISKRSSQKKLCD